MGTRGRRHVKQHACRLLNVSVQLIPSATTSLTAVLLFALAASAQAQLPPKPVDIAEVQIGKPFPHAPFNKDARDTMADQLGFYSFDAPNAAQSKLPFSHYQVAINNESRVVYYVRGAKPYGTLDECLTALQSVAAFSRARYGVPRNSKSGYFDEVAGDLKVEAGCSYAGLSPYPQLAFTIMSVTQKKELDELRRKRFAR